MNTYKVTVEYQIRYEIDVFAENGAEARKIACDQNGWHVSKQRKSYITKFIRLRRIDERLTPKVPPRNKSSDGKEKKKEHRKEVAKGKNLGQVKKKKSVAK
jgi:hypothetical protein